MKGWWIALVRCAGLAIFIVALVGFILRFTARSEGFDDVLYARAFYDHNHQLLRLERARDDKYRLFTKLAEIPPSFIEATLLLEDRYFYLHPGVNPLALARTALTSIAAGHVVGGGSTLTMQLARLRYRLKTRTLRGKLIQIWHALVLEAHYSKDEILEAYLNLAPYGGNVEGVGAASLIYLQKPAANLTTAEALLLAVLPQSPTRRTPARADAKADHVGANQARDRLLRRWLKRHPEQPRDLAWVQGERQLRRPGAMAFNAPHLVEDLATTAGGSVVTTIDLDLQKQVERQLRLYVEAKRSLGVKNAAALLVDYTTMAVVASVGSVDFNAAAIQGEVNGTKAKRSPGSTLKPFIYALAMDQGLIHPLTLLKDAPTGFGEWHPENFDRDFVGPLTAHDALIRSRNVPAIYLAGQLKNPSLYEFLRLGGVRDLRAEGFYGLALALGGAELTMEDLVRLYAMLANGGELRPLRKLASDAISLGRQLLSPEAAAMVLAILRDNPRPFQGYQSAWLASAPTVAWKTGTSPAFRDAWAIGTVGPYVAAVWLGNFDGESNPAFVGLDLAGPLFFRIVDALRASGMASTPISGLNKLKPVRVCALSGQLPGPYCRHTVLTSFIPGVSPIQICDIHRAVTIDRESGLRSCPTLAATRPTREVIMEFWSSDLLRLFRHAGMPRVVPPPWHPGCSLNATHNLGHPPRILSPDKSLVYQVRSSGRGGEAIALQAVTDGDAVKVFWFLDNGYIGAAAAGKPLFWSPKAGEYTVRVVDDVGRAAATKMRVSMVD